MADAEDYGALLRSIQARISSDANAWLQMTHDLNESDFALVGKFIQLYCFADLKVLSALAPQGAQVVCDGGGR